MGLDDLGVDASNGPAPRSGGSGGAPASNRPVSGAPSASPEARFQQLMGAGLTKEQAYARMREERY